MQYKWAWAAHDFEESLVQKLSSALNLRQPLTTILLQRGVDTFEKAKTFFNPKLENLHDPLTMKNMDKATSRLKQALEQHEKVMIYGDYDVDGTTSVALVYSFLRPHFPDLTYYIPDRYSEGYGLSFTGIDRAEELGISLIITLDCGIKALEKVEYANHKKIDVIICDHHLPPPTLPPAHAILNPKQNDCCYPYKELTGCGIGFKFMSGFADRYLSQEDRACLFTFIDLVAVSTACDLVPMDGENRILMSAGLAQLAKTNRLGLKILLEYAGMKSAEPNVHTLVFGIGPRINAAGRIKHAQEAVKLLISEDEAACRETADQINTYNIERKGLDRQITSEALAMIPKDKYTTVLYKSDWHKGVIGIVASRCIEHYHRPTVILTPTNDGCLTGSARSIAGFNLYDALDYCSTDLKQFGGHYFAAGLKVPIEKFESFKINFEAYARKILTLHDLIPKIKIDTYLSFDHITPNFYKTMTRIRPFGPKNMTPVFVSHNVNLVGEIRIMKEKHFKFTAKQKGQKKTFTVIGFNMVADYYDLLKTSDLFSICYQVRTNTYRDKTELQLYLKDIKPQTYFCKV